MDFVSLVADIIPIKGGQCSFYFELPINRGFTHKKGVSIRHYLTKKGGKGHGISDNSRWEKEIC